MIALWVASSLKRAKTSQLRRNAFISSALNHLNQGVLMTDPKGRVVFCNDRYLEIYGLARSEVPPRHDRTGTAGDAARARRARRQRRGFLHPGWPPPARPCHGAAQWPAVLVEVFHAAQWRVGRDPSGLHRPAQVVPQLASTTQFLELVLDNVPVCVAAKNIQDGRYIFANRAFERFSRFSRDHIIGKRADEIFRPETATQHRDRGPLGAAGVGGYHRSEFLVERGDEKRILASNRVIARNENNEPEFLIALFDDVTDRRSLSRELENTKKFLELVVDNIPVSLIVERVSDGKYLLANRSAETILNRRREDATGLTATDIFNPREAKLIVARDEAAIKKRGLLTEEHPISTKDGLRLSLTRRMTVLDELGEPQYLIKTHADVTDRRQTELRMAHMAYHDGLTDMPNRAAFLQALAQMIEACAGTDEEFAALCVDLDGLKEINDVFGHAVGDKLLIEVSRRIQDSRARRRGGAALRRRVRPDHPRQAAPGGHAAGRAARRGDGKRIPDRRQIGSHRPYHRNLGISAQRLGRCFAARQCRRRAVPRQAEIARFDQRVRAGDGPADPRSPRAAPGPVARHQERRIVAALPAAGDLAVTPLRASKVIGSEALARWMHPVRGFVSPGDFIPLAEEAA